MEKNNLLPEKDTKIQLVVNNPDTEEDTIDLGRVFHNMRVKSRVFIWVLVLCLVVGISTALLLYQFQMKPLTVTSVVTLRYDAPNPEYIRYEQMGNTTALKDLDKMAPVSLLVTPEGEDLDLGMISASSVLQEAVNGLALSAPVTLENLRSNLTVSRVLTEASSRTQEVLSGLAGAKNSQAYERLEKAEMEYKNRFVVSLTNGFGEVDSTTKYYLTDEELKIVLNRILDAYNAYLVKQYANIRLPEDKVATIDMETQDLPEVLDSLGTVLDDLYTYCEGRDDSVKEYRSWQTGLNLNDWMETIQTIRNVSVEYLDADVYARGLIRDKDAVILTFRYRLRTLQSELDKVNKTIEDNAELLKNYKNNEVLVSMQESDASRSSKMTTEYYNELVIKQQKAYAQATELRTEIAEMQNKIDRLNVSANKSDIKDAETAVATAVDVVRNIQDGIRSHMIELFASPLYTTYSEHSAPQGKEVNFLVASAKKMIIFGVAGVVVACGLWFLAALAPEFQRHRREEKSILTAEENDKEAVQE